jgi:hypothetical protein
MLPSQRRGLVRVKPGTILPALKWDSESGPGTRRGFERLAWLGLHHLRSFLNICTGQACPESGHADLGHQEMGDVMQE